MPRIQLPNGKTADFPDTMSSAEITAELDKAFPVWQEDPSRGRGIGGVLRTAFSHPMDALGDLVDISTTSAMAPFEPLTALSDYGAAKVRGEKTAPFSAMGSGTPLPSTGGWGRLAADVAKNNLDPISRYALSKMPSVNAVAERGLERVGELTNPGNLLPLGKALEGSKLLGGIIAAGAGKSAISDLRTANEIYQREGASHDFWQTLTDAGVDSALFIFVARGLREGKTVEEAVKEAPSEMGKGSSSGTTTDVQVGEAAYGQMPGEKLPTPEFVGGERAAFSEEAIPYGRGSAELPPTPKGPLPEGDFPSDFSRIPQYGQEAQGRMSTPKEVIEHAAVEEGLSLTERQKALLEKNGVGKDFPLVKPEEEGGHTVDSGGQQSPILDAVVDSAKARPEYNEMMEFGRSIWEATVPKVLQFMPPDLIAATPFAGDFFHPRYKGYTQPRPGERGGNVFLNPLALVEQVRRMAPDAPVLVQARLLKKVIAETTVHEMSHAADRQRSIHSEVESGIPNFTGDERFALVNQVLQTQMKPEMMRLAEKIPDETAVKWMYSLSDITREAYGFAVDQAIPKEAASELTGLQAALADRPGEQGAVTLGLLTDPIISIYNAGRRLPGKVKRGGDLIGDWMRTSVAGDLGTSVRNVYSGTRMIGQNLVTNSLAASLAESRAQWYQLRGMGEKAAQAHQAAAIFAETAKAYPSVGLRELPHTLLDMWDAVTKEEGVGGPHGAFQGQIEAMKNFGLMKEATALDKMSAAELLGRGETLPSWKRLMMLFNIAGDRAITRTVLSAHLEAIQKVFDVKDAKGLAKLAQDPTMRPVIRNYLEYASSEAMRAAWNLPYAHGGKFQQVVRDVAALPVVGVLTVPFGRALAANYLPGVLESMPLFNHLSKRVRNSYEFDSLSVLGAQLTDQLRQTPKGVQQHVDLQNALTKNTARMRELRETGVYSIDQIRARTMIGPLVVAGAAALRYMRGDDGTEFDQLNGGTQPGGAVRAMNFNGMLGEVLPYVFYGDYLGHYKLWKDGRTLTFKYAGGSRTFQPEKFLGKAFFGSRYGYQNPSIEILKAAMEVAQGKKDFDKDYFMDLAGKVMGDAERMATSGAWIGGLARGIAGESSPEEAVQRRSDLEAAGGAKSQVPGLRTSLPPAQDWLGGGARTQKEPLLSSTAVLGTAQDISPLEQWINRHQGQISMGDVLPRRSRDPKFDELYNRAFTQAMQEEIIPFIQDPEFRALPQEEQVAKFVSGMQKARKWAHTEALYAYQDATGALPAESIQKAEKKDEKKERDRLRRGGPSFPKRREPRP